MRVNISKLIITVFIVLFCGVILVFAKHYIKTVQSFKTFYYQNGVAVMSNQQNFGYNELKQSLIDKYTKQFVSLINDTSNGLKSDIANELGYDYTLLSQEYVTQTEQIAEKQRAYYLSDEFLLARRNLEQIKLKIDNLPESEKDKHLDEFRTALNDVSLLNTKLNNQLKGERERLDVIKSEVLKMFKTKRENLLSIRKIYVDKVRTEIFNLVSNYNIELKELNLAFSVEYSKTEYPFDMGSMQDFSIAGKLETDCFNEILDASSTVFSENTVKIES